jgi:5'-deoxynucleotidase YfbR-like HD superfamily hydrolase
VAEHFLNDGQSDTLIDGDRGGRMPDHALAGVAAFLFEMGHLKRVPRYWWLLLGIPQSETIAEHSFRVGIIGMALAAIEGADVGHTSALCLLHDAHETRIGDVPSVGRAYVTTAAPEAVSSHQTAGMPDAAAKAFQELTGEFEVGQTIEAQVARDADTLETLLQAIEYQAQGHDTTAWQETSIAALRTKPPSSSPKPSPPPTRNGGSPSPPPTANCAPAPKTQPQHT